MADHWRDISGIEKAVEISNSLPHLLQYLRGPRQDRRKLMVEVVAATVLHGSSVFKKALDMPPYTRVYRLCA